MHTEAQPRRESASRTSLDDSIECVKLAPYDINQYDEFIQAFYRNNTKLHGLALSDRIDQVSQRFLKRPYQWFSLGEGPSGQYDQAPLYRFDRFDCVTFVNTVLALSISNSLYTFQKNMSLLNYKRGDICYANRHHFMSSDWNHYNQQAGLVRDITEDFLGQTAELAYAETVIDRPAWFQRHELKNLRLLGAVDRGDVLERLESMRSLSKVAEVSPVKQAYIPLSTLFSEEGVARRDYFQKIPQAAILELVRPNWDLRNTIGTCINVSHVGFVIHRDGTPYLRHASSLYKSVVDTPLIDYLQVRVDSPTIKGIHLQELV